MEKKPKFDREALERISAWEQRRVDNANGGNTGLLLPLIFCIGLLVIGVSAARNRPPAQTGPVKNTCAACHIKALNNCFVCHHPKPAPKIKNLMGYRKEHHRKAPNYKLLVELEEAGRAAQ